MPQWERKAGLQSWLRWVCVFSPRVLLALVFNTWYRCHPWKVSLNPVCQMWLYVACHTSLNRLLHFAFCRNMSASFQPYRQIAQPWSRHRHCLWSVRPHWPPNSYSGLTSEPCWRPLCPKGKCLEANHSDHNCQHINFMLWLVNSFDILFPFYFLRHLLRQRILILFYRNEAQRHLN